MMNLSTPNQNNKFENATNHHRVSNRHCLSSPSYLVTFGAFTSFDDFLLNLAILGKHPYEAFLVLVVIRTHVEQSAVKW